MNAEPGTRNAESKAQHELRRKLADQIAERLRESDPFAIRFGCADFQEHPGWRNNQDKTVGVTWDAWCSMCGFRLENKPWASGLAIEGEGRRLAHVVSVAIIGGERFVSDSRKIVCSKCCPVILGHHEDLLSAPIG